MARVAGKRVSSLVGIAWNRFKFPPLTTSGAPTLTDNQVLDNAVENLKLPLDSNSALQTHATIVKFGYEMSPSVVPALISTYASCGNHNLASQLLEELIRFSDLEACNFVIGSFVKCGHVDFAQKVFAKMPHRDVVSWNSIISGFVKNGLYNEALRILKEMLSANINPDEFTFASLATACARLGALHHAEWLHGLMKRMNITMNRILHAALVDMYAKCGKIEFAKEIFLSVPRPCLSAWNAMINGLALHGLAQDAISMFINMEMEGIAPDALTFVGVLSACSHCGLVEQGQKYFDIMNRKYLIEPELEHYGTMVDLLGRAGRLEEAYATIRSMPMKPDVVIWRALLSACRTHKNSALGEVAVANMSSLESGDYVLLSNTYSYSKSWSSAASVRNTMRRDGVRKNKGKSWVEMGGIVYQFMSGDRSHPETTAIYTILERVTERVKREGFVSATEMVLMDISEEEKEENLAYHSEKLAASFFILKTGPGVEVRISKNLRTCYDCHSWFKMVSKLLHRPIIVRDRIRFHRFERGSCSCGDYW